MGFHFNKTASLALAFVVASGFAQAATLAPGSMIFLPGTDGVTNPELDGAELQDEVLTTNVVTIPEGTLFPAFFDVQNRVVASNADGSLVFLPRILPGANATLGDLLVDRVEISGFGDFVIDAFFRVDGPGDRGPTTASRSGDGDILTFDFGFPLVIGNLVGEVREESFPIALNTEASAFANIGRLSVFARAQGDDFNTYRFDLGGIAVPTMVPIPVPASVLLLLSGVLGLFGVRRLSSTV